MRIIICGSRAWSDPTMIEYFLRHIKRNVTRAWEANTSLSTALPTIVHGAAKGADRLAGQVARDMGFPVEEYPADWNGLGKKAGLVRNRQMLDAGADLVVAFKHGFDGTLRRGGTENMIRIASEAGVRTLVMPVDTREEKT